MKNILVLGSLNMDISMRMHRAPEAGETLTASSLGISPGGKGANQAYAAAKLGGHVAMLGAVGTDTNGAALCQSLASVGVDVSRINRLEDESTGAAVIFVEDSGENRIAIVAGANSRVDREYIDANFDMIEGCDILVMQLEIPVDTVLYAAKKAKALGKTVIIDPAPALPNLPEELWACADYIKPNETELNILLTGRADGLSTEEALRRVQRLGAKNVWVTMGSKGVFLHGEYGEESIVPAHKVQAVDTTAAGDVFTAAAAVSLSRGSSGAQAAAWGNKAAALSVTRRGAQSSVPAPEEIEDFFNQSRAEK